MPDAGMLGVDASSLVDAATGGCENGEKDDFETGTDCGGPDCGLCPLGQGCLLDTDCDSGLCGSGFVCVEPTCDDGEQNGDETDVDCGGGMCPPCGSGDSCTQPSDCESGDCTDGQCVCVARTAADCPADSCNPIQDGCGGTVSCMCQGGLECNAGSCVEPAACDPDNCRNTCFLAVRCCTSDGECGCDGIIGGCN